MKVLKGRKQSEHKLNLQNKLPTFMKLLLRFLRLNPETDQLINRIIDDY